MQSYRQGRNLMRQKAKKDTAEADIGKAIDVWDCRRSLSGGVVLDWRR